MPIAIGGRRRCGIVTESGMSLWHANAGPVLIRSYIAERLLEGAGIQRSATALHREALQELRREADEPVR
jgi:hypothetical protein